MKIMKQDEDTCNERCAWALSTGVHGLQSASMNRLKCFSILVVCPEKNNAPTKRRSLKQ